jgi:phage terminase large subunit-like protein
VLCGYDKANGAYLIDMKRERGMTLQESVNWLSKIASQVPEPTVKIEDVGAQTYFIQEAQRSVPGHIQSVSPGNNSKEERITDMSVLFERGDVQLINHSVDTDLGYDPRHRSFIREWLEFGSGNSPDLLDACYYALQDIALGDSGSVGSVYAGDFYS